ncbi:MAG: recombinase family protein [Acidimicrobiales bacterium]
MSVPTAGTTGLHWHHDGHPATQPPGWGTLTGEDERPVCFRHRPAVCTCLHDHPLAMVYVRRQAAMINGRAIARGRYEHCMRAAARLDALVVGRYLDDGSSEAPERPGLDALLDRLAVIAARHEGWGIRRVEYVIVAQADQLARRTTTWQHIHDAVTGTGARVILVTEVPA